MSVAIANERGWAPGTLLLGREVCSSWWAEAVIEIVEIADTKLVARTLARRSVSDLEWRRWNLEHAWNLEGRDWRVCTPAELEQLGITRLEAGAWQ